MQESFLILFSRAPIMDQVKKRLARDLGSEIALAIHNRLFERTLDLVQKTEIPFAVFFSEKTELAGDHSSFVQNGKDLGERMYNAIRQQSTLHEKICLIGSDCHDITSNDITTAFKSLSHSDVVIGPAADGGYYLIGMRLPHPELFVNIEWGKPTVLKDTLNRCEQMNLNVFLLSERHDVDTVKDVPAGWL